VCEHIAQAHYLTVHQAGIKPGTSGSPVQHANIALPSNIVVVIVVVVVVADASCLACYLLNGHVVLFTVPGLKLVIDLDIVPSPNVRSVLSHQLFRCIQNVV